MTTVSYTRMEDGTFEDYQLVNELEDAYAAELPDRLLALLRGQDEIFLGMKVSLLTHQLQTATRALRDGASEEMVVAALVHDVGDVLAPCNHSEFAATILRPYVEERTYWMVRHHGVFQAYYYNHHLGLDRNLRDRYRDHPHYQDLVDFCARWDQASFDPEYDTLPLEAFEDALRRVFTRPPYGGAAASTHFPVP